MIVSPWQQRLQRLPARGRTVLISCFYGLVTLHDLLRAQTNMAQRSKEDV